MEFRETYGCCTAKMIYGMSLYVPRGTKKPDAIRRKMGVVENMIKSGYFLDFAVIYAFTTKSQLDYEGSFTEELLKGVGFTRAFDGNKGLSASRHKETGEITLWAISPVDYKSGLDSMLKTYQAELNALETPEMKAEMRASFPDFTLTELVKTGIATRGSVKDSFAERIQIDRTAFENHIQSRFGVNPRSVLGLTYWNGPILTFKEFHQAWKRGEK